MTRALSLLALILSTLVHSAILNVTDYGANGNDEKDDSVAFQKCANELAARGGGTMNIPAGNYHVRRVLFLGKKFSNIIINGNGSTIKQTVPLRRKSVYDGMWKTYAERYSADGCFVFDSAVSNQDSDAESIKNIKIIDLNFISDVEKLGFDELTHQISAHGVSNFSIYNCTFTGFLGDGISINAGTDYRLHRNAYNKNIVIRNCKFDGINNDNRQGVSIYYADGFLINQCIFKNTTRHDMPGAIDIEPNADTQVSRNGIISNCSFENIGGLGAITIHLRNSSCLNQFSNKNFVIEKCTFRGVRSPFCIVGNEKYMDFPAEEYTVMIRDCSVRKTNAVADIRSACGVLFQRVNFYDVNNVGLNTVTDVGSKHITFDHCLFDNVRNLYGIVFYGKTRNINFTNSTFKNFAAHAITINDPEGIGDISNNTFQSSDYAAALPLVTSDIKSTSMLGKAHIQGNRSLSTFKPIDIKQFIKK